MKPLKFRAWHDGAMRTVVYLELSESGVSAVELRGNKTKSWVHTDNLDSFVVMQFTGLVDKRGKEIYEGDIAFHDDHMSKFIVKWCDGVGAWTGSQVGWMLNNGYYTVEFTASQKWPSEREGDYAPVEILGNIYENPDLLNDMGSFGYDPLTYEQKQEQE